MKQEAQADVEHARLAAFEEADLALAMLARDCPNDHGFWGGRADWETAITAARKRLRWADSRRDQSGGDRTMRFTTFVITIDGPDNLTDDEALSLSDKLDLLEEKLRLFLESNIPPGLAGLTFEVSEG